MITIVYCSKTRDAAYERRLIESSGMQSVEILWFPANSFAEGYNQGLEQAKTDIVVFVREDVDVQTKNWGKKLVENFEKSDFGVLGVVGSLIVPMSGLVWEKEEPLVGRIWYEKFEPETENRFSEVFPNKIIPVVTLEDSFFAVDKRRIKEVFDKSFAFDSFYDLDFFLANYSKGVKLGVTFDIKILKLKFNECDEDWKNSRRAFVKKQKNLPFRLKPEIAMQSGLSKLTDKPKVSLIIAAKGKPVEIASCLEALFEKSKYPNLEIFIADLGSKAEDLDSVREYIKAHQNVTLIESNHEHLPSIYQDVVDNHVSQDSELLLFSDPNIVVLNDAIARMVKTYLENKEECGTLGIRMHTRNNMVRHFGLQLFSTETEEGNELGLGFYGFQSAYKYKNKVVKGVLGSSMDFIMIPKQLFHSIGGFNKTYLHSLEDFEFNMKTIIAGKKNFLVGTAVSYFLGSDMPKFLPEDFETLVEFVNANAESLAPFVDMMHAA